MAFKKPSINVVKPDIKNASVYIRSVKKWGKSTLFARMIEAKYHDPKYGLLVEVGNETGTTMLDNVNTTHVNNYSEFLELQDWLINNKSEHEIQIVGFDTTDEMVEIFDKEIIRRHNAKYPQKMTDSINAAMGGYGEGPKQSAKLMKEYFNVIRSAGIQTWAIGHTKYKSIKDKANVDTEGYMQLTSNLGSQYEAALGDVFDVVLTGVIDRSKEKSEGDDSGHVVSAERRLYFRGTPEIDAGGRFKNDSVPEFMVFEGDMGEMAKKFLTVFEGGMSDSKTMDASAEQAAIQKKIEIEEEAKADPRIESNVNIPADGVIPPMGEEVNFDDPEELRVYLRNICNYSETMNKEQKNEVRNILISNSANNFAEADRSTLLQIKNYLVSIEEIGPAAKKRF